MLRVGGRVRAVPVTVVLRAVAQAAAGASVVPAVQAPAVPLRAGRALAARVPVGSGGGVRRRVRGARVALGQIVTRGPTIVVGVAAPRTVDRCRGVLPGGWGVRATILVRAAVPVRAGVPVRAMCPVRAAAPTPAERLAVV